MTPAPCRPPAEGLGLEVLLTGNSGCLRAGVGTRDSFPVANLQRNAASPSPMILSPVEITDVLPCRESCSGGSGNAIFACHRCAVAVARAPELSALCVSRQRHEVPASSLTFFYSLITVFPQIWSPAQSFGFGFMPLKSVTLRRPL